MKRNVIKLICFCLLLGLLFMGFWSVFQYRFVDEDGIEGMQTFYEAEENSIDVMFFGSSHMFVNVNTAVLWDEYGIAAYNLGGSEQRMWNTYYYMKEALKTQTPKVLVVDCYGVTFSEEFQQQSGIIKNTFGMKLSADKIEAIKVSAPDNHLLYLLGYPGFHGRYTALSEADFLPYKGIEGYEDWKGHHFMGEVNEKIADIQPANPAAVTNVEPITAKNEQYLRAIIDLAKKHDIPLVLMATPYCVTNKEQSQFNRVAEIANETGVPFINFNLCYGEIGLDFATDFADGHHLNYLGTPKFTRVLADYLTANYEIPVRSGEPGYEDYDRMAYIYAAKVANQNLIEETDLEHYLAALEQGDYVIVYTLSGDYKNMTNLNVVSEQLLAYDIDLTSMQGDQAWVVDQQTKSVLFTSNNATEYRYHMDLSRYDTLMVKSPEVKDMEEGIYVPVINFNNTSYNPIYQGLTIFVYDKKTESLVDAVGFYLENGAFYPVKWRE